MKQREKHKIVESDQDDDDDSHNQSSQSTAPSEYLVRDIIDVRPFSTHYLVRWIGYLEPTWEPLGCLTHCREALNDFIRMSRQLTSLHRFLAFEEAMTKFRGRLGEGELGAAGRVQVVNEVDFVGPPGAELVSLRQEMSFHRQVMAPRPEFLVGCHGSGCGCEGGDKRCDCLADSNHQLLYDKEGRLTVDQKTAIYECNERCGCDPSRCRNRVTQSGIRQPLAITRLPDDRGWGVTAVCPIPKGAFIDRYYGEMVTVGEAEKRAKQGLGAYLFDLDYSTGSTPTPADNNKKKNRPKFAIDARCHGSVSRFLNHSCSPNLLVVPVFAECQEASMHGVAFFAARDIEEGEQLCFDYTGGRAVAEGARRRPCLCGASNCQKYIFL
jgi:histone-lysine N-methyltransferase SUV39H